MKTLHVILGNNIDTEFWVKYLSRFGCNCIILIDYEHCGKPLFYEGYICMSPSDGFRYIKKSDNLLFYKSYYIYPGQAK